MRACMLEEEGRGRREECYAPEEGEGKSIGF
jgi:hypothetical protein